MLTVFGSQREGFGGEDVPPPREARVLYRCPLEFSCVSMAFQAYFHLIVAWAQPRVKSWGSESGKARIKGAKRPRFDGETRIEGKNPSKSEGGV